MLNTLKKEQNLFRTGRGGKIYQSVRYLSSAHYLCSSPSSVHSVLVLTSDPWVLFGYVSSSWDWRLMMYFCVTPLDSVHCVPELLSTAHLLQQLPVVQSNLISSIKSLIKLQFSSSLVSRSALNLQCCYHLVKAAAQQTHSDPLRWTGLWYTSC